MKGKHKDAAERRRAMADLVDQARAAEKQATLLRQELDALRENSTSKITALSNETARLRKQRDTATGPALAAAEQRIRELMEDRDESRREHDRIKHLWGKSFNRTCDMVQMLGFTRAEALEVVLEFVDSPDGVPLMIVDELTGLQKGEGLSRDQMIAIAAARGKRSRTDVVQLLKSKMQTWSEASGAK